MDILQSRVVTCDLIPLAVLELLPEDIIQDNYQVTCDLIPLAVLEHQRDVRQCRCHSGHM